MKVNRISLRTIYHILDLQNRIKKILTGRKEATRDKFYFKLYLYKKKLKKPY